MDTREIFQLLKHLTGQTSVNGLTTSLIDLLSANFSGVKVAVYEMHVRRLDDSKQQQYVCYDCLKESETVALDDAPELNQAFISQSVVTGDTSKKSSYIILPVVLYDKSISHLIRVEHPYKGKGAEVLLMGLLEIFTDIFRNLHEKGYDPLTRILNRQAFDQVISDIAYANKLPTKINHFENHQFSTIAILDIDKFKSINDQFGHAIGDETLVLFTQTIRSVLRQDDLFFRYGGEEFVVFVKEVDREQAISVLERCRLAIEQRRFPQVGKVTMSVGVADLKMEDHPLESLSKADKALYHIKSHGRNQVLSYEYLIERNLLEPIEPIEGSIDFWDDE